MNPQTMPGLDQRQPKYREGQFVIAATDLYNDGSHPDAPEDQLLAVPGCLGEIVQVGHHADENLPIYMVDFGHAVIGCLEEELEPPSSQGSLPPGPLEWASTGPGAACSGPAEPDPRKGLIAEQSSAPVSDR